MERHQLEDRIRASLQARADDVTPTPALWERVSARTGRRARWQVGAWALSGVAAVAALVVGGVVLLGSPRGVEIAPEPDVVDSPTTAPSPTDAVPGGPSGAPTIVTTDGTSLFRVDPATGEVAQEYTPRLDDELQVGIREVAVRPADDGQLTVATVVDNEGSFEVDVYVFDGSGERVERRTIAMAAPATDLPPDVAWSQDGQFLMWAGLGGGAGPALWAYDWAERPEGDRQTVEPFPAAGPGAPAVLFDGTGVVDLREWTGDPLGDSRLVATTTDAGAFMVEMTGEASDCGGAEPCPPTFTAQAAPLELPGLAAMDLGTLQSGINLALAVPTGQGGGPDGGAEDATLSLVAEPTDEQAQVLDAPQLTTGTVAPGDAWLAAAGDRVAIGKGPEAHLLTVTGERAGEVEITSSVALPDGTVAAGMAPAAAPGPSPSEVQPGTPTEGPALEPQAVLAEDGVPAHVITYDGGAGQLALVDRRSGDAVATWPRPEGLVVEAAPVDVVVHPASTPADLELVTRWSVGEAETFVRTVVRDGTAMSNEPLPDELQPTNQGAIAEMADSVPVFSPTGDWFAWLETPDGADGPTRLQVVPWGDQGPAGNPSSVDVPDDVTRPVALADWASPAGGDVLTFRPMSGEGTSFRAPAAMVEFRIDGADPRQGQWATVELPGILFDAGSATFDDGAERYIAFDGGDDVLYGLAEAPGSAVPTGAFAFSEGRVVAFGPGSALVQQADGSWQRVQVDDGATSAVEVPGATVAVLPWPR